MTASFLKKWTLPILFALLLFGAIRLYYRLTDDFRLANMTYSLPFKAPWSAPSLDREEKKFLTQIFDQPFYYIGKGAQCYAFASQDQKYVLKFFKFKHLKPNWLVDYLPPLPPFKEYKERCIERKERKLIGVFNGYDLAYNKNKEGSRLIYLHLVPTDDLHLKATVVDKIGLKHEIPLDDVVFLVQKKGETLRTRLRNLLDKGKKEEAKLAMAAIVSMYIGEYQKGLYDHDHGVLHNTGFVEDAPFHLDVGKLNRDERMKEVEHYKRDLEHVIWKMDVWMKHHYPNEYPEFASFLSSLYQEHTGEPLDTRTIDPKRFKKERKLFGF